MDIGSEFEKHYVLDIFFKRKYLEIDQVYGIAWHRGFRSKSATVFGGMVLRAHGVSDKDTVTLIK